MSPRWRPPGRAVRRITRNVIRRQRRYARRRARRWLVGGAILLALSGTHNAYKMNERDVDRLENHYGRPAEELTEEEIVTGMRQLGISRIELDDDDRAKIYSADHDDDDFKSTGKKYCIYCGHLLDYGANYCKSCGSKV